MSEKTQMKHIFASSSLPATTTDLERRFWRIPVKDEPQAEPAPRSEEEDIEAVMLQAIIEGKTPRMFDGLNHRCGPGIGLEPDVTYKSRILTPTSRIVKE